MKNFLQLLVCSAQSSFENAVAQAVTMVEIGGIGHTSGLYTDQDT